MEHRGGEPGRGKSENVVRVVWEVSLSGAGTRGGEVVPL